MLIRDTSMALVLLAAPVAAQQVPTLTATQDLAIDAVKNHLARTGWIGVTGDGAMIVTQPTDHVLRYFSKDGAPVASVGKEGESDGEFATLGQTGWIADTVWVYDNKLKRLTFFSPQRKVLRVVPTNFDILLPSGEPMPAVTFSIGGVALGPPIQAAYGDGTFMLSNLIGPNAAVPAEWKRPAKTGAAYFRVAANGVTQTFVAWAPAAPTCTNIPQVCPRVLTAVASNGSAVAFAGGATTGADSGKITVSVMSAKGDTVFSRMYPFAGVPVPQAYGDSVVAAMTAQRAGRALPPGATAPPLPTFQSTIMPPVTSLVVGRDGTIWVGQATTGTTKPWLVLDAKGNPIGTVSLPGNVTVRAAERGMIWGTERTDVAGVENVVRYVVK